MNGYIFTDIGVFSILGSLLDIIFTGKTRFDMGAVTKGFV